MRPERLHDPSHLGIERLDAGIGIGKLVRHAFASERPGEEHLVADGQFAVVEGMFGEPVCWRRRLMPPVSGPELLRRLTRIVRHRERHPGKERRIADPGEKLHRRVAEQPRGMDPGSHGLLRDSPAIPTGGKRRHRDVPLVGHAPEEHVPPRVEAAHRGGLAIVPFAGEEGPPSGAPEHLRPGVLTGELLVAMKEAAAGEHHRPAGDADGAVLATHAVGPVERGPPGHQRIECWRPDERITERVDRVGPLVIGDDHEHARGAGRRDRWKQRGHERKRYRPEEGPQPGTVGLCRCEHRFSGPGACRGPRHGTSTIAAVTPTPTCASNAVLKGFSAGPSRSSLTRSSWIESHQRSYSAASRFAIAP